MLSATSPLLARLPGVDEEQIRRLRRDDYALLVERGAFENEHVELIRGVIVRMVPHGALHAGPIQRLSELLVLRLSSRAAVRVQLPLIAPDDSEPQPDIAVVPRADYDDAHPSEAFLIAEVADSSLAYDRNTKGPLYAAMNVPEFWIVNVRDRCIEVHGEPSNDHYAQVTTYRPGDTIALLRFPDVHFEVSSIIR